MRTQVFRRSAALAIATGLALTVLSACGDDDDDSSEESGTVFGPSQELGNGTVKAFTTLDDDGNPTEVGVRLSSTALEGLTGEGALLMLAFPDEAAETAFDHVMLNWNPAGHEPEVFFAKPHFDFHFDMTDMASIQAINPTDPAYAAKAEHAPDAQYVPQDFVLPPGPPVAAQAVPNMGVHLVDSTDTTLVPGSYDFKEILINGTWDGKYTFIEPMITREFLLTGPTVEHDLKLPQAYQQSAYYPTTYKIRLDEDTDEYVVSLGGMTQRTAS